MKRLYFFRHSLKDGVANSVGPKGLALAQKVGGWVNNEFPLGQTDFTKVFHGILIRTAQSAMAFLNGLQDHAEPMPAIDEFGSDLLFAEMTKHSQFRVLAGEMGNYRALLQCHDPITVKAWADYCFTGLQKVFDAMADGEIAVAFGHSPSIELAIAGATGSLDVDVEFVTLNEMQGVVFEQDDAGTIKPVGKLAMPDGYVLPED